MRKFLFFIFFSSGPLLLYSQSTFTLSGKITNWEDEPLIGATVFVHELNTGTLSDADGNYIFEDIRRGAYHLHITYIGHESVSKTIVVSNSNLEIDFELKPSTVELNELLVEANPFKSGPVEQSMTIETVDRDFLLENNGGTFVGSLQKLPGINAINTGVGIAKPVIRGMSFNRVIVNDRGIKQEGQQWGTDHGLEIDQFEPDRIEIIKGPASLLYGSDAMGGVINIRPAPIPAEGSLKGNILTVFKSNNNLYGTSSYLEGSRKGKFFSLRFSTQDFGDYKIPADSYSYNDWIGKIDNNLLENTAGKERNVTGTVGISKNWGYTKLTVSNFHQKVGFFPGAIGLPQEYEPADDGKYRDINMPRQNINHFKIISNSSILLGQNWLEMDFGYQNNLRREEGQPHIHGYTDLPETTLALELQLQTFSGNLKYHRQVSEKYNSLYGFQFQYQRNAFGGFEFLLPAFTSYGGGAYTYHEYKIDSKATINGGIRLDYGKRDIQEYSDLDFTTPDRNDSITFNPDIEKEFVNASGALGLSYYPHHNFNAKLNLGTSFKMPTAPELSMNGPHHGNFRHEKGNPDLDSERGYQIDLNITYHTSHLHVGLTPYFSYYNQYIYLRPSGEFSRFPALGQMYNYEQNDAIFTGGEISTEYHFISNLHIKVAAEYVWNLNLDSRRPLPFTPPFSLLGEIRYDIPMEGKLFSDSYFGADAQFFAAQNRVDRNEKTTPGYSLFAFNLGTKFKIGNQRAVFKFSVQNLLNERYLNHLSRYRLLSLPEQGRNFVVSLKIPFAIAK